MSCIERGSTRPIFRGFKRFSDTFPDLNLNWLLRGQGEMLLVGELELEKYLALSQEAKLHAKKELQEEKEKLQVVKEKLEAERLKSEALEELLIRHRITIPRHKGASP
ncbi:hypothetical protein GCM10023188_27510 [Pontibacter saemangeumensis]|uniref:Transposase n=1 Tax=Pontibacter saemangeumensis TaxID=1084525 RepID=A0ABP8LU10_9BACT